MENFIFCAAKCKILMKSPIFLLIEEQVSNYSNVSEKALLDEYCLTFCPRFLPK